MSTNEEIITDKIKPSNLSEKKDNYKGVNNVKEQRLINNGGIKNNEVKLNINKNGVINSNRPASAVVNKQPIISRPSIKK